MLKVTRDMSHGDVEVSFFYTRENSCPKLNVKAGVGFSFSGIVMENHVEVIDFESDEIYQSIKRALEM